MFRGMLSKGLKFQNARLLNHDRWRGLLRLRDFRQVAARVTIIDGLRSEGKPHCRREQFFSHQRQPRSTGEPDAPQG
jgi:hypothetical protein